MVPKTVGQQLANRLILGLFGIVLILFAAGALLLGLRQEAFGAIGYIVTVTVAVALLAAGLRQIYHAIAGHLPRWYTEVLLFGAGVLVGGPDRK
ncbi:MAG: hypothetical protein OER90_03135 [Gemmatimonadota bacterium]|nr:hypothetical protein [Gemmatimonadota bacterium]